MTRGGRPPAKGPLPSWFKLERYAESSSLDARDWYLNLYLRKELADPESTMNRTARSKLSVRLNTDPLLRHHRITEEQWPLLDAINEEAFAYVVRGLPLRSAVRHISPLELKWYPSQLPEPIAEFIRSPDVEWTLPETPLSALDEIADVRVIAPVVRIDLSMPDKVLREELAGFLRRERRRLKKLAPRAPYLKGLSQRSRPNFGNWLRYAVLPFLDIQRWALARSERLIDAHIERVIGSPNIVQTKHWAAALQDDFILRRLLIPEIRGTTG